MDDIHRETRKTDLRVQKTQKAIRDAFKEMVMEMDPDQITVRDLTERAAIHRKTFYLHYTCIEALFEDVLNDIAEGYFREIDKLPPDAPFPEVNRVFFTFMARQEPYVERMVCTDSYRAFSDKLFLATRVHNRSRYNPYAAYSTEEQNLINTFLCVGSVNLYRQWVADGKKLPLENLISLTNRLFESGISSIRGD